MQTAHYLFRDVGCGNRITLLDRTETQIFDTNISRVKIGGDFVFGEKALRDSGWLLQAKKFSAFKKPQSRTRVEPESETQFPPSRPEYVIYLREQTTSAPFGRSGNPLSGPPLAYDGRKKEVDTEGILQSVFWARQETGNTIPTLRPWPFGKSIQRMVRKFVFNYTDYEYRKDLKLSRLEYNTIWDSHGN